MCYLAQAEARQAKNPSEEAAMKKKLSQEVLAEEIVFQEKKQWHSGPGVGCSAGNGAWPRQGCLEVSVGGRRSKVLSNGNRGHIGTWLGCPGSLVWLRQETCLREKISEWGENEKIEPSWFSVLQISLYHFCLSTEGHDDLTTGQVKTNFRWLKE